MKSIKNGNGKMGMGMLCGEWNKEGEWDARKLNEEYVCV